MTALSSKTGTALAEKLLDLCSETPELLELATYLNLPSQAGNAPSVKVILELISAHREDDVTVAVQTVCRSLKNLDDQVSRGIAWPDLINLLNKWRI